MIHVGLTKRPSRKVKKNGQRAHVWTLRWIDPKTGEERYQSTKTADKACAEDACKAKWYEVNGLVEVPEPEPEPPAIASWEEARAALERAMKADNLRPSSITDALQVLDQLRAMFPATTGPADITATMANEFKRRRAELGLSTWTIKGDIATLKATFGKWLGKQCNLLDHRDNPFADVTPPRCDDPEIRIVSEDERRDLYRWLDDRWNNWKLPKVYLDVAGRLGWRAMELASLREEDLLPDCFVRCIAESSKTRKAKVGQLPPALYADLKACCADGWAFGRFADELRRLLLLWKRMRAHAARVGAFSPQRLAAWFQHELPRYHADRQEAENEAAEKEGRKPRTLPTFSLHDFRRTAITDTLTAGVSMNETGLVSGVGSKVIGRHYYGPNLMDVARRANERLSVARHNAVARPETNPIDQPANQTQTVSA